MHATTRSPLQLALRDRAVTRVVDQVESGEPSDRLAETKTALTDAWRQEGIALSQRVVELEQQVRTLSRSAVENETLHAQMSRLQLVKTAQQQLELEGMHIELSTLKVELNVLISERNSLVVQLGESKVTVQMGLEQRTAEQLAVAEKWEASRVEFELKIEQLVRQRDLALLSLSHKNNARVVPHAELESLCIEHDGLKAERDGLVVDLSAAAAAHDGLAAELESLRTEHEGLGTERDGLVVELSTIRTDYDGLGAFMEELVAEVGDKRSRCNQMTHEHDELKVELNVLISERNSLVVQLGETKVQCNAVSTQAVIASEKWEASKSEFEVQQELEGMMIELSTLRVELNVMISERNSLVVQLGETKVQCNEVLMQAVIASEKSEASKSEFEVKIEQLVQERDAGVTSLFEKRKAHDELEAELESLRTEREGLGAERDGLVEDLSAKSTSHDGLAAELESLRTEHEGLGVVRDGLVVELSTIRTDYDGLVPFMEELVAEVGDKRSRCDQLMHELSNESTEHDELKAERDGLVMDLSAKSTAHDELEAELESLRCTVAEFEQVLHETKANSPQPIQHRSLEHRLLEEQELVQQLHSELTAVTAASEVREGELQAAYDTQTSESLALGCLLESSSERLGQLQKGSCLTRMRLVMKSWVQSEASAALHRWHNAVHTHRALETQGVSWARARGKLHNASMNKESEKGRPNKRGPVA